VRNLSSQSFCCLPAFRRKKEGEKGEKGEKGEEKGEREREKERP